MQARIAFFPTFLLLIWGLSGCAGGGKLANTEKIDPSWAGLWKGKLLLAEANRLTRPIELDVVFTSTNIRAFWTDSTENLKRLPVRQLQLENGDISFKITYESLRGIDAFLACKGQRSGKDLVLNVLWREGGKTFRGGVQARRFIQSN